MKIFEVNYMFPKDLVLFGKLLDKYNFKLVKAKTFILSNTYIVSKEDIVWLTDNRLQELKGKLETAMIAKGNLRQLSSWLMDKEDKNVFVGRGY